jgi:diacylglycerol kinase (ATP)
VAERVAVIINPISGTGGRPEIARQRVDLAAGVLSPRAEESEIFITEYAGHARALVQGAIQKGTSLVIAWGGDGTINEVASQLVFRDITLGIIPSGSGNGLARELRIPFDARAAFRVALDGRDRVMDAGELDGHLFFNIAGIGLDARVAHQFASNGLARRGFVRYLEIAARELFTFVPDDHTILADGVAMRTRALVVALANARQYGNGAFIAPQARIDDGKLDVVVVAYRSPLATLLQAPMLFAGRVASLPGVDVMCATNIQITSARPVLYHVDGEPFIGGASVTAGVHPRALRVRIP